MKQINKLKQFLLLCAVALFFYPQVSTAQTSIPFVNRYEIQGINGDLTIIGNSILGENSSTAYNGTSLNNSIDPMVFIDIDGDPNTFSSTSANFTTHQCNKVVYAGLYWGAVSTPATPAPETIKFKIPGGAYQDITADVTLDLIYYKDVTSIVTSTTTPSGDYFVANVNATEAKGNSAGWSLVIVYEDPSLPRRYISTFDGFSAVKNSPFNAVSFNYSGFTTPPSGPVEGRIGVAAMEGDLGLFGDHMQFKADNNSSFTNLFDAENDANNFFNSKITENGAHKTNRNVNSTNTLGWDQKLVDFTPLNGGNNLIGNNETGATVRVTNNVGGDHIFTFLNTFAINIIEPIIQVLTSVEDTSGNQITLNSPVQLGETVWYNINFKNIGTDNAISTSIVNTLPINVTLDESSIILPTGASYTYNSATRQLTFTIPNSLVLKESDPANAAYDIRYQVTASNDCFDYTDACTNLLENFIESNYGGETSGTNITDQPGLNGINGCGLGNVGSMDLFVDTSSCNFDSTETFCNNNLTISGHDGYNIYKWVDANGTVLAANSKEITVAGPGVYTCTQTRVGCSITERVITVLGIDFALTPSDALCKDQADGKIKVDVTDIGTSFTYELTKGGAVVETVGPIAAKTHTFTGLDIGGYSIKVTNNDGCHNTFTTSISEPTLLEATNTTIDNIMPCNGNVLRGRIEVTATGGSPDYQYSIDGGANYQASNVFEVTTSGNHTITVKDSHNCITTTVADVNLDEDVEYTLSKEDVVCLGDATGKITVSTSNNTAGNTFDYSIDGGATYQSSATFTGLAIGDYEIIVRKVKGTNTCETPKTITIDQLVFLTLEATGEYNCDNASQSITATVDTQYANDVTYTLDGTTTSTTGVFDDVAEGVHTITVRHNDTGCTDVPVEITVEHYEPIFITDVTKDATGLNGYVIQFNGGIEPFEFAMNDLDAFVTTNSFSINHSGIYTFYVKDEKGCIAEFELELKDIEVPNFFTPDGDGINDTWYPNNVDIYPNITVDIFDRYQRLLVSLKGIQASWDGSYKNKPLPSGDYWYHVKLNEVGDDREFKGNFTLFRSK